MNSKQVWKDYYDNLLAFYLRRNMKFDSDALPAFSGWKWTFEYLDAERAAVDAYGYKIPEDTVSIQFFVFNKDGKLESFFLEEPEGPPKEASAKSRTQEMMDWMMLANQQIQDPNVSFEEVQANLQENYAAKLALKDVQPTEKSVLEEKERIST
ncbi:hypothetical protein ACMFMF_008085 [Clarireedia jacksonii]